MSSLPPPPPSRRLDPREAARTLVLPRVRTFNRWGGRGTLLAMPLLLVLLFYALRHVASREGSLTTMRDDTARVMAYETRPGDELRVALYAGADLVRCTVYAYGHPLRPAGKPTATLLVTGGGSGGVPQELVTVNLNATSQRFVAEEPTLSVGDPTPVNVAPTATRDVTLKLVTLDDAEGVLVRCFQRVTGALFPLPREKSRRTSTALLDGLGDGLGDYLDDAAALLPASVQNDRSEFRWVRAVPTHATKRQVRAHALLHTMPPPAVPVPVRDRLAGTALLRPGQRLWLTAKGAADFHAIADQPTAGLQARIYREGQPPADEGGVGTLTVRTTDAIVALTATMATRLQVWTRGSENVVLGEAARVWRLEGDREATVRAETQPLIVRVTVRRPLPPPTTADSAPATTVPAAVPVTLRWTIRHRKGHVVAHDTFRMDRFESLDDRYAEPETSLPSERASFYVTLPATATLAVTAMDGPVDVTFAELRAGAHRPAPVAGDPSQPHIASDHDPWFVPRRPSNANVFAEAQMPRLRLGFPPPEPPVPPAGTVQLRRPNAVTRILGETLFVAGPTTVSFHVSAGARRSATVRLASDEAFEVQGVVDGGTPKRRVGRAAARVTMTRTFLTQKGETSGFFPLGDDLLPGWHTLRFQGPPGKTFWVALPWSRRESQAHWVEGEFD